MPKIVHPNGTTAEVPAAVLPYWTGLAGWKVADTAAGRPAGTKARKPRTRRKAAAKPAAASESSPARDAGAPDDVPGKGSSTTTTKE